MNRLSPYEEKELFLQIAEGNEIAFKRLFELYGKLLYPFLFRTVKSAAIAEELIQEAMLRVWLNRDKLPEIEHPRQWIFRIAANLAFTGLQKKLTEQKVLHAVKSSYDSASNLENEMGLNELKRKVQEAVKRLPKERKRIYLLSREAGMSRDEIAEKLSISPNTVKNEIVKALQFIREELQKEGYIISVVYLLLIIK